MIYALIIIAVCGNLYYLFNEVEDWTVRGHNFALWPNSSDPSTAKWTYPFQAYKSRWYNFGYKPNHKERFAYSSTIFSFITDGEHLFQWLKFRMIDTAMFMIDWRIGVSWIMGTVFSKISKELFIKQID